MADNNFVVKNGLTVNNALTVNSTSLSYTSNTVTIGTAAYFIANGNVGIGTSSPTVKLYVSAAGDATFNSQVLIAPLNGANPAKITFNPTTSSAIAGLTDGTLVFYGNGANTERMRIDSSGNLLVGTTVARNILTVTGPNAAAPTLGTASGTALFAPAGTTYGTMIGSTGGGQGWIQQQRVDTTATAYDLWLQPSGGLVTIGTNSPTTYAKLTIAGAIQINGAITSTASTSGGLISYESPVTRSYIGDGTGYSWAFSKRTSSTTTDLSLIHI